MIENEITPQLTQNVGKFDPIYTSARPTHEDMSTLSMCRPFPC